MLIILHLRGFFIMKTLQTYNGNDLGAVYTKQSTQFRLWAPTADSVRICFYATGDGSEAVEVQDMQADEGGTWVYTKEGDLHQLYYTYLVNVNGNEQETNDPYGKGYDRNDAQG